MNVLHILCIVPESSSSERKVSLCNLCVLCHPASVPNRFHPRLTSLITAPSHILHEAIGRA